MEPLYTASIIGAVIGVITALVAKRRGRNPIPWFFIGFGLSCFGLLFVLLLPPKSPPKGPESTPIACLESSGEAAASSQPEDSPLSPAEKTIRISLSPSIDWYYVTPAGLKIKGPFKIKELRREVLKNQLGDDTYIWCEELADWTLISSFQNYLSVFDADFVDEPEAPKSEPPPPELPKASS